MRRRLAALILGITAVVAMGAPVGAQEPPNVWAREVCTALTGWGDAIRPLAGRLSRRAGSPARAKRALVATFESARDTSQELLDDIRAAGAPDVPNGPAIARVFRTGVTRARTTFADAAVDAAALPTGRRTRFDRQVEEIGRRVDDGLIRVQGVFDRARDRYPASKLDEAFEDSPACDPIVGS